MGKVDHRRIPTKIFLVAFDKGMTDGARLLAYAQL
jgi:hypothetical protein